MHGATQILSDLVVVLAAALPIVLLFQKLRLPSIVGFLIAGAMAFACAAFVGSYPPALPNAEKKKQVNICKVLSFYTCYIHYLHL